MRALLPELHALALTLRGEPTHPLYLKASLVPAPYRGSAPCREGGEP